MVAKHPGSVLGSNPSPSTAMSAEQMREMAAVMETMNGELNNLRTELVRVN